MSRILLTGVGGFVASNVFKRLLESKHDVLGIENFSFGSRKNIPENAEWIEMDFANIEQDVLDQFDVLVHCATSNIIYCQENPVQTFDNNAKNTIGLFSRFKGKIIYTGTTSIYGNADEYPTPETSEVKCSNAYDTSKYIAQQYLQCRWNYTTLLLSNVYGTNQLPENPYCGVLSRFLDRAMNELALEIYGDGMDSRDYSYIDDVVDAIIKAVELPALNTEINIATGIDTTIKELADLISKSVNVPTSIKYVAPRKIDKIKKRQLDITKAKELLKWQPKVKLEQGILKTIEWYERSKGTA